MGKESSNIGVSLRQEWSSPQLLKTLDTFERPSQDENFIKQALLGSNLKKGVLLYFKFKFFLYLFNFNLFVWNFLVLDGTLDKNWILILINLDLQDR